MDVCEDIQGVRVLVCAEDGPILQSERDIGAFLGEAWAKDAAMVAIPVARLGEDFFRLNTRLAGDVAQKFANYRMRLAILGDVSPWQETSKAFADFVREANRGQELWFANDVNE